MKVGGEDEVEVEGEVEVEKAEGGVKSSRLVRFRRCIHLLSGAKVDQVEGVTAALSSGGVPNIAVPKPPATNLTLSLKCPSFDLQIPKICLLCSVVLVVLMKWLYNVLYFGYRINIFVYNRCCVSHLNFTKCVGPIGLLKKKVLLSLSPSCQVSLLSISFSPVLLGIIRVAEFRYFLFR